MKQDDKVIAKSVTIAPEQLDKLVNLHADAVGRTVSTSQEPNVSGFFHFWLTKEAAEAKLVDIGSVIVAYSDDQRDLTFGIVNELKSYSDSTSFIEDYVEHRLGKAHEVLERDISEVLVATCAVVRNLSGKTFPVGRSRIYFPTPLGVQYAFGIVGSKGEPAYNGAAIPIGVFENGDGSLASISIDENFLVGPDAAHLNVSGISGLSSKTSALSFCLKSLLTHTTKNVAVVVMNVKSKDLLYMDVPNTRRIDDPRTKKFYEVLGIPLEPFTGFKFFGPAIPRDRVSTQSLRELPTERFRWDLQMIYDYVPSLFHASEWDDTMEGSWYVVHDEIERGNITTYDEMLAWIDKLLASTGLTEWPRGYTVATWRKLKSHMRRFTSIYRGLIAGGTDGVDIPWNTLRHGLHFCIDIQMLSMGGQKLVFGRVMKHLTGLLETHSNGLDAIIVFVDELNKFAPLAGEHSTLKSQLIEVTARGRSLGLILFGAQQFASMVDKEIVENCATVLLGRTESTELHTANYSRLSGETKTKVSMLPQGQLLVKYPKFPQPIFVKFPFPPSVPGDEFKMPENAGAGVAEENPSAPGVGLEFEAVPAASPDASVAEVVLAAPPDAPIAEVVLAAAPDAAIGEIVLAAPPESAVTEI